MTYLIPAQVGARRAFDGSDVIPEKVDSTPVLGQTVSRRYAGAVGPDVMLIVSYHGARSPDLKVHRPETCYKVAGFAVDPTKPIDVLLGRGFLLPAVTFSAQRGPRRESVLYWTRVGRDFPQSLVVQRKDFIAQALTGLRADGLLVRISMLGETPRRNSAILCEFAVDLLEAAGLEARHVLLGPLSSAFK